MIKLDIQEYCHNCPSFEPEKVMVRNPFEIYTFVQCENRGKCGAIAEHIREELNGKENHGQSGKETQT